MNLAVNNPNFSIIVPSGCNAQCDFCFWKEDLGSVHGLEYLRKLNETLQALPAEFNQCSITGGEPTMSNMLREILMLVRLRFDKVVLTSNAYQLDPWMFQYIDHLNISRHHFEDGENEEIFRTNTVPPSDVILSICDSANEMGVDVTINTVLSERFDNRDFIHDMVQFTKDVNANALCFRKEHGNLKDLPVEHNLTNKVVFEHSCGVCLLKERLIGGIKTTWRYVVKDPSDMLDGVYELIFQQDCKITSDWAGNEEIHILEIANDDWDEDEEMLIDADDEDVPIRTSSFFGGGCGGSISGCGR